MNHDPEVVIIGAALVDIPLCPVDRGIFDFPSYPLDQISMEIGGDAINEATVITRLGHRVRLVTCIGEDPAGRFILEHCARNQIDDAFIRRREGLATSINVALITPDGERTFLTNRRGSLWSFAPEDIDLSCLNEGSILSFASIFNSPLLNNGAMVEIFRRAKARHVTICADIVGSRQGETLDDIREALSCVDYFFPNYQEACALTGRDTLEEIAGVLLDLGIKTVVIKTGRQGAFLKTAGLQLQIPAYGRAKCIDTTGAGDNFVSGFLCGLLENKPAADCGRFACAVSSLAVEQIGATTGVRSRQQVERRYQEYLQEGASR